MFSSVKQISQLYFGLTLIFLSTIVFELQWLHYATKPLFMILLMVFQWKMLSGLPSTFSKLVQFGLFFSWIGDIALMFDEKVEVLFVVGLAAFLIAHLGYAYAFVKNVLDSGKKFNVGGGVAMAIPFALVTGSFFYYMKDGLPTELFIPVLAYTIVITLMGITSAWRKGHVKPKTYTWILVGAILFILSDMVIAINKFVVDFDYDAIVNMILYLTGQFMIAVGAVYHQQDVSRP